MARYFTDDFKKKIIELKTNGKSTASLVREYNISKTTINTWQRQFNNSGLFTAKDNLSDNDKKLQILLKENKQLKMENDILKQAALILGRK